LEKKNKELLKTIAELNTKITTIEANLSQENMKSYHFKKDTEAKIKEQNNEISMLEKDRFDLIKANMLVQKQEN